MFVRVMYVGVAIILARNFDYHNKSIPYLCVKQHFEMKYVLAILFTLSHINPHPLFQFCLGYFSVFCLFDIFHGVHGPKHAILSGLIDEGSWFNGINVTIERLMGAAELSIIFTEYRWNLLGKVWGGCRRRMGLIVDVTSKDTVRYDRASEFVAR
ncbi:hypothetical protein RF11_15571 [Thelohanellus kitauei]|uniref:Uncharacterized protein n=1 Tax=Thelohanellus kitauei TaxID=669202 RepID=A0A0C2MTC4_THEKT|nr:hypothetical protein RF11_15571 [Thelohanellus kitauei]